MEITEISFVRGFIRMCNDGWEQGWHERNGGNLSYRLKPEEVEEIRPFLNTNGEWKEIGADVPKLSGEYFMVTGSGKYFRNVILDPADSTCILEVDETGSKYRICWGLVHGGRPTSELPSHLMNHEVKKDISMGKHRVIYHAHPANVIALTFVLLTKEIEQEVGYSCQVVLPATHDTGSAVLAVPSLKEDTLYISSGTWSLLGVEQKEPICTEESRQANFTNEGGYAYRYRYLKNIMGLWMIQSVRRELPEHYAFSELCDLARENQAFPSRVDVNAAAFLAPESMIEAIQLECARTMQPVPRTPGELAAVIYQSLAESYAKAIKELERLTGIPYDEIHIVGGGSNAEYLNELTAEKSGLRVLAGPAEATAIGNLAAQMIAAGVFADYREARACILQSCEVKSYSHTSIA